MRRIAILTGAELRHVFFCKYMVLYKGIELIKSYSEGQGKSPRTLTGKDKTINDLY
jgi:hypothetical protein